MRRFRRFSGWFGNFREVKTWKHLFNCAIEPFKFQLNPSKPLNHANASWFLKRRAPDSNREPSRLARSVVSWILLDDWGIFAKYPFKFQLNQRWVCVQPNQTPLFGPNVFFIKIWWIRIFFWICIVFFEVRVSCITIPLRRFAWSNCSRFPGDCLRLFANCMRFACDCLRLGVIFIFLCQIVYFCIFFWTRVVNLLAVFTYLCAPGRSS